MRNSIKTAQALRKYKNEIKTINTIIYNPNLRKRMIPLFYKYFKAQLYSKEEFQRYFLTTVITSEYLQVKEKDILDIGCGFGLRLIELGLLGARKAIGVDISKEMIEGFQTLLSDLPQLDITTINGDFLDMDFPRNSFDIVHVEEAISHIRDTQLLLNKIQYVLRPNGILYIQDWNSTLFLPTRIRIQNIWKQSENGPIDKSMAKIGREVDKLSFIEARKKIINELHPSLDSETIEMLARKTKGMYGDEISKAVEEFIITGKISQNASFQYRNPYTGEFPELGLNPFKLLSTLKNRGFRCRIVRPPWIYLGISPLSSKWKHNVAKLVLPVLRNCPNSLTPFLNPCFSILAKKESR